MRKIDEVMKGSFCISPRIFPSSDPTQAEKIRTLWSLEGVKNRVNHLTQETPAHVHCTSVSRPAPRPASSTKIPLVETPVNSPTYTDFIHLQWSMFCAPNPIIIYFCLITSYYYIILEDKHNNNKHLGANDHISCRLGPCYAVGWIYGKLKPVWGGSDPAPMSSWKFSP